MDSSIRLADIMGGQEFLREMQRAADISYNNSKESGFVVYIDDTLSHPQVNRAVIGDEHSIDTDMSTDVEYKSNKGAYIPADNYRLVHVHFHPTKSDLHPSEKDINNYLAAKKMNETLRDSAEFEREVYEDEDEIKLVGHELDFLNSVAVIGLVGDKPENIELLVYQGIPENPVTFYEFCEFVENYCKRLYGKGMPDASSIEMLGFPTRFRSTKKVVEFLNASGYFRAVDVKIRNGKISKGDLKKLSQFKLVETKFFPQVTFSPGDEGYEYLGDELDGPQSEL